METCECNNGGSGTCPRGTIPMCYEILEKCHARCASPPRGSYQDKDKLINWLYKEITGESESNFPEVELQVISKGTYQRAMSFESIIDLFGTRSIDLNLEALNTPHYQQGISVNVHFTLPEKISNIIYGDDEDNFRQLKH
ncbi:protein of unknown function [Tenacibaculum sp. 190524A02b]|uniref:hypothetical protein n=1 Tax=Tenacibaculum vairaonense TaxID=3137860 RepID=UPI0032B20BE4